jgi:pimeloyl-ACP methyl ester carboxylesterase
VSIGFSDASPAVSRGSATGAPGLPAGFQETFTSRYVDANGIRMHVVTGGDGPPVYLLGGWPQTWYAWRFVMPSLADQYKVVAIDPRGAGLSDKPQHGYDSATLAADVAALADALGHSTLAIVGHDIGMWTSYALAVDHPGLLERLVVVEAIIPGLSPSPPLIGPGFINDFLWHFSFNRVQQVNEELVRGREAIYFGNQFATKSGSPGALSAESVEYYIAALREPDALRASFEYYRAIDQIIDQNQTRRSRRLEIPVLAIGGGLSCQDGVEAEMRSVADDVTGLVIPDRGHFLPEEAPEELLAAVRAFLEPYAAASTSASATGAG